MGDLRESTHALLTKAHRGASRVYEQMRVRESGLAPVRFLKARHTVAKVCI